MTGLVVVEFVVVLDVLGGEGDVFDDDDDGDV
jgi:hypothetical protein